MRRMRAVSVVTAAVLGSLAAAVPASAYEPVEGVWRAEGSSSGAFLVQQKAPGVFRSVTIQGTRDCVADEYGFFYLVGSEREVRGRGLDYFYAAEVRTRDCAIVGVGLGVSRVIDAGPGNVRLAYCNARPGTGLPQFDAAYRSTSPDTQCAVAVRIREPVPPVTLASFAAVPRAPRCTRQARRRGRTVQVRLSDQANEPVLAMEVQLGRRVVYRYDYPGTLAPAVAVALPARRSRLSIVIRTTSNKFFAQTRRFSRCGRSR